MGIRKAHASGENNGVIVFVIRSIEASASPDVVKHPHQRCDRAYRQGDCISRKSLERCS